MSWAAETIFQFIPVFLGVELHRLSFSKALWAKATSLDSGIQLDCNSNIDNKIIALLAAKCGF
jgi:hypothetical protein